MSGLTQIPAGASAQALANARAAAYIKTWQPDPGVRTETAAAHPDLDWSANKQRITAFLDENPRFFAHVSGMLGIPGPLRDQVKTGKELSEHLNKRALLEAQSRPNVDYTPAIVVFLLGLIPGGFVFSQGNLFNMPYGGLLAAFALGISGAALVAKGCADNALKTNSHSPNRTHLADAFRTRGLTAENAAAFFAAHPEEAKRFLDGLTQTDTGALFALQKRGFETGRILKQQSTRLKERAAALAPSPSPFLKTLAERARQNARDFDAAVDGAIRRLENPGAHPQIADFEQILAVLDELKTLPEAISELLDAYSDQLKLLERMEAASLALDDELARLEGVTASYAHYPFRDEAYRQERDLLDAALADLRERARTAQETLKRFRDEGCDAATIKAWTGGVESTRSQAKASEVKLDAFVAAERRKLKARYEAVMARRATVTLHSLPIGSVKAYLQSAFPGLGVYDEFYDEEEAETKLVPRPIAHVSVRDMLKLLGGFGEVLGDEVKRLADPRYGFARANVVTKISYDMAKLSDAVAKAFMQDPAVIASDEFAEMGRAAQIQVIRQTLEEIAASGDAALLPEFFTNLEIFTASCAKEFWLLDAPKCADSETGLTLLDDLKALRADTRPEIAAAVAVFWNHYLAANGLLRKSDQA